MSSKSDEHEHESQMEDSGSDDKSGEHKCAGCGKHIVEFGRIVCTECDKGFCRDCIDVWGEWQWICDDCLEEQIEHGYKEEKKALEKRRKKHGHH
jgi:hypothetical protein